MNRILRTSLLACTLAFSPWACGGSGGKSDTGSDSGGSGGNGSAGEGGSTTGSDGPVGVQDLWVLHDLRAVLPGGDVQDLIQEMTEIASDDSEDAVPISEVATFRPANGLEAHLRNARGVLRDDVEVIGGLIEADDDVRMVAFFATAEPEAPPPRSTDVLSFRLPAAGELGEGVPLVSDYQFVQVLPDAETDGEVEAGDSLGLLAARLLAESYQYPAAGDDDDPDDLVFTSELGSVLGAPILPPDEDGKVRQPSRSSFMGGLPPKAKPYAKGFGGGLRRCLTGFFGRGGGALGCVKKILDGQKKGAEGFTKGFDENLKPDPAPPSTPTPTLMCNQNCGSGHDDPHMSTFDHVFYDLQLAGEFVAARSPNVEVQMRSAPVPSSHSVAIVTNVAVGVGDHVIEAPVDRDTTIVVDGEEVEVPPAGSAPLEYDDVEVWSQPWGIDVWYDGDPLLRVSRNGVNIDFYVQGGDEDEWLGLLGNNDGNQEEDLVSRDGDVVDPVSSELYDVFANSWRLEQEESLFSYDDGEDTETFTDLDFPDEPITVDDLDAADRKQATTVCGMAGIFEQPLLDECVLDYVMTGDIRMVQGAQAQKAARRAPNVSDPTVLEEYVTNDRVYVPGVMHEEERGGELAIGEGLALFRTSLDGLTTLHAIDLTTGQIRWSVDGVDFRCRPVVVEGYGVAAQLDREAPLAGDDGAPIVLLSLEDGSELARSEADQAAECMWALSSEGSTVLRTTRSEVKAYDAANGMATLYVLSPDDVNWEWAPSVQGHFMLFGRELQTTLRLRSLDPTTGDEIDALEVGGASQTWMNVLGEDRVALVANTDSGVPRAITVVGVDEDGGLEEVWRREFPDDDPLVQPNQLAPLDDLLIGWTSGHEDGYGLVAFDAETGDVVWTYASSGGNSNPRGLLEPVNFGAGMLSAAGAFSWLELVDAKGEVVSIIEEPPVVGYTQPQTLTALPDGRVIVTGPYQDQDETGAYLHFLYP